MFMCIHTNPGYWQIWIEYILTKSVAPLDHDEMKMDLLLANVKNDIFPLISTVILPKVLNLCYPMHIETLAVIY